MKKKYICVILFSLTGTIVLFAQTNGVLAAIASENFRAMDIPLLDGMGYFLQTSVKFADIASLLAILFFIVNICWNAFRLWMGTQQVRKAAVDIITKYLIYVALFMCYNGVRFGVLDLSMRIGAYAGTGAQTLNAEFSNLQKNIQDKVDFSKNFLIKVMKNGEENGGALTDSNIEKLAGGAGISEEEVKRLAEEYNVRINSDKTNNTIITSVGNTVGGTLGSMTRGFGSLGLIIGNAINNKIK